MTQPLLMIVDDDSSVRKVVESMLRCLGCQVASAPTGAQALTLAQAHRAAISGIFVDATLDGAPISPLLAELDRLTGAPVVVMSGLTAAEALLLAGPGRRFLAKPFGLDELRQLLDALQPPATLSRSAW
ncbi:MAG TPA: response regulator [Herpetosiphonaceae bacterium]